MSVVVMFGFFGQTKLYVYVICWYEMSVMPLSG